MEDNFDIRLRKMAEGEEIELPEDYDDHIENILNGLPEKKVRHITWKAVPVLVAVMVLVLSVSVTAAINYVRQRMESMEEETILEIYDDAYKSVANADKYSRDMTDSEKKRYEKLESAYMSEGVFPEGELKQIESGKEYDGKGVAFLSIRGMYFYPEEEMSDEELLQIIDFEVKREYSWQVVQEKVENGEIELPEDVVYTMESGVELSDEDVVIDCEEDMKAYFVAASGQNIYFSEMRMLANNEQTYLWKMAIGSGTPVRLNIEAPENMEFTNLTSDAEGNLCVLVLSSDKKYGEYAQSQIWKIDRNDKVIEKIDITAAREGMPHVPWSFAADSEGRYYMSEFGGDILIVDQDGTLLVRMEDDGKNRVRNLCCGKDGRVYGTGLGGSDDLPEIVTFDVENEKFDEIYTGILQEGCGFYDCIAPGQDSDLLVHGAAGVFAYNLGDKKAEKIIEAYELPEDDEMCFLPDGTLFMMHGEIDGYMEGDDYIQTEYRITQFLYKKISK